MIDDIHEPVALYKNKFKELHAQNVSEFFEALVKKSGVDEAENKTTVTRLNQLEQDISGKTTSHKLWGYLRIAVVLALVLAGFYVYSHYSLLWLSTPTLILVPLWLKLNKVIKELSERLEKLVRDRDETLALAEAQMKPLNNLFDWEIFSSLLTQTLPQIELDPYFSNARLDELKEEFAWQDSFNKNKSIQFSHSGVIRGNPFVVARGLDHWMGEKTYQGSLQISWTEPSYDSKGNRTTVRKYQTLHASINKPHPEYRSNTFIVYGNEAAPNLSFSRSPSNLSTLGEGFFDNWKKKRAIKKLEDKSRAFQEGNSFSVMANREFDAIFGATDRDHEVQFRLLFTPLAQQEMVNLLKDQEVGFGDDFRFTKSNMINVVEPVHFNKIDIDAAPAKFQSHDLARARGFFNAYHNRLFKSFYFGMAPLLTIPLFQQHRTHRDIYKDTYGKKSCFWEHEAIANFLGEGRFKHPSSVTRNILKTEVRGGEKDAQTVKVTAYGYEGIERIHHVSVHGGDGNYHKVPVHWIEYIGVQQSTHMTVKEQALLDEDFSEPKNISEVEKRFRRSLVTVL